MSFSIGIIGLPNAGKSTLFKALTKKQVDIAPYVFCTREPNKGIVAVPDARLQKLAAIIKPEKITPTIIEFIDIAGLVKGAHKGDGLGNKFLSQIRACDAILHAVRAFHNQEVEHTEGSLHPQRDVEIISTELLMKDSEILENAVNKLTKEAQQNKKLKPCLELFEKLKQAVSQAKPISSLNLTPEEQSATKEYQFLTAKPVILLENYSGEKPVVAPPKDIALNLKLEEEISELSEDETQELGMASELDQLIASCYNILELITFFTITGQKETRAWTLKKGSSAIQAAGQVHTDFAEKFIKAEVINWQRLIDTGSWANAREKGAIQTVGRDYVVQDGDIIEFKM